MLKKVSNSVNFKKFKKLEEKKIEIETQYNVKCEIIELDIEQKDKVKLFLDNQRDDVSIIIMAVGYLENEEKITLRF